MKINLKDKCAIVTGASRGLGFAVAMSLAECGASVFMCARNQYNLASAAEIIKSKTDSEIHFFASDISQDIGIDNLIRDVKSKTEGADIVFISGGHPPILSLSESKSYDWQKGYQQVLKPAIRLTGEFVGEMKKNNYGRFIYVSSVYAIEPEFTTIIQSTYRAALNSFSKCIATENAGYGITANTICPGFFSTSLVERISEEIASKKKINQNKILNEWREFSPSGEFGNPNDLGAYVSFLCSDMGKFINGRSHVLDGGATRGY